MTHYQNSPGKTKKDTFQSCCCCRQTYLLRQTLVLQSRMMGLGADLKFNKNAPAEVIFKSKHKRHKKYNKTIMWGESGTDWAGCCLKKQIKWNMEVYLCWSLIISICQSLVVSLCRSLVLAPFTLPFACKDPAPILQILLCVKVLDAARGEISLRCWSASGGRISAVLLGNRTSVYG